MWLITSPCRAALLEEGFRGAPQVFLNPLICTVYRDSDLLAPTEGSHQSVTIPFFMVQMSFRVLCQAFLKFLYKDKYICQLHR